MYLCPSADLCNTGRRLAANLAGHGGQEMDLILLRLGDKCLPCTPHCQIFFSVINSKN